MMARFPTGKYGPDGEVPGWVAFIREVCRARPGTFGTPDDLETDSPRAGYRTERYTGARVIHGPGDEGVRVIAEAPEVAEAFTVAAARMGIHLAGPES